MAKISRKVGSTSQILQIFVRDSSSTVGLGLAALTSGSSGLTAYYHRDTDTTPTAISLTTMTLGMFTSSGFLKIDDTNMKGAYQFCPPNACFASGASSVMIMLFGATNMAPVTIEVDLDAQVDVTFWNGTVVATPATAGIPDVNVKNVGNQTATAAAGVTFPSSIASPTNITAGTITTVTTVTNQLTAAQVATGIWQDATAGDFTAANSVGKSVMNGVALGTGLTVAAVSGAVGSVTGAVGSVTGAVASVTGNVGGNVTGSAGSVIGAVGSVTGAVGSVTGNVGGNVVGSVASVTATVNADIKKVNGVTVNGDGSGTPWGP